MTSFFNRLKRAWFLFMVRSLERELHDQREAVMHVTNSPDLTRIMLAEIETREELAHYRAEYCALLPIGERRTWELA